MTKSLKLSLLLVGFNFCLLAQTPEVVGGQNAPNIYSFMAGLQQPGLQTIDPFCGGALIHPEWILTAGHCVQNPNGSGTASNIDVVINAYSLTNPNGNYEKIEADRIIPFPGFSLNNGGVSNDIALIHLKTPSMHTPIQLPTVADSLLDKDGALVSVIGWGVSDTANTSFRIDTLQEAEIDVIHNNICNETSRYNGQISDSMICAGKLSGPPTGGGAGDSGGPLFSKVNGTYIVLGAVSFGQKQFTNARYPGVYTRVREYLDWIDQTINSIGVEDQTKLALQTSIYQTQNKLTLEFKQALLHPVDLTIVDISGRVLQQSQIESGSSTVAIPLVHHSAGLYLVKLNTLQAHLSQKIVLE